MAIVKQTIIGMTTKIYDAIWCQKATMSKPIVASHEICWGHSYCILLKAGPWRLYNPLPSPYQGQCLFSKCCLLERLYLFMYRSVRILLSQNMAMEIKYTCPLVTVLADTAIKFHSTVSNVPSRSWSCGHGSKHNCTSSTVWHWDVGWLPTSIVITYMPQ